MRWARSLGDRRRRLGLVTQVGKGIIRLYRVRPGLERLVIAILIADVRCIEGSMFGRDLLLLVEALVVFFVQIVLAVIKQLFVIQFRLGLRFFRYQARL